MTTSTHPDNFDASRREWLIVTTAALSGAAIGAAAVPFLASMAPSQRAKAAGAPVEVDVGKLAPGEMMTVEWRGKPVWILRRTPEMLAALERGEDRLADPKSERPQQPDYAANRHHSIQPDLLVAIGICAHLGCSPTAKLTPGAESGLGDAWPGGFLCPCHGSKFDLAGRVHKSMPAPTNLEVPPHMFLSDSRILWLARTRRGLEPCNTLAGKPMSWNEDAACRPNDPTLLAGGLAPNKPDDRDQE